MLVIDHISRFFGEKKALDDVAFDVAPGEVVGVLGPNGAGKSTLLRSIAGGHKACHGDVRLNEAPLSGLHAYQRVRLGLALVPEGRRLFPQMTIQENLALGTQVGRKGSWSPDRIFEMFPNLAARRHNRAQNLSGGEQQATAIGRALVTNPDVLLLDEVSLGLSPAAVDRVYSIMPELRRSQTSVIVVEQDLLRALSVADRVICMLEGQIILMGKTSEFSRDQIVEAYFGLNGSKASGRRHD